MAGAAHRRTASGITALPLVLPILGIAVAWAPAGAPAWAQGNPVEYAVKATYLYKFLPFVAWPGEGRPEAYVLCVVGDDPFGPVLDRVVEGQSVDGSPIVVRRMPALRTDAGCHVVYAGGSAAQPVAAILAGLRGRPVLSVTDGARDAASRGMVNFVVASNRVRFEIDDALVGEAGLAISSKLLGLATIVRPRNRG